MEDNLHIADLISAYILERLTPSEEKELNDWLNLNEKNQKLFDQIVNEQKLESGLESLKSFDSAAALKKIKQHPQLQPTKGKISYFHWIRIAVAASVVLALSFGSYLLLHKKQQNQIVVNKPQNDIAPGTNRAILTLANGKKIVVTGASNGTLAQQANMTIVKSAGSLLNYQQNQPLTASAVPLMNTLSTPMGAESGVTLPDGTQAKLDAASSITFPVNFSTKGRRVTITGQVHFKVKYKADQPFFVTANGQTTQDLGTEFNISAYPNEPVTTTLIEGSIQVSSKKHPTFIKLLPGQQAVTDNDGLKIGPGDPEEAAAWANGYFRFSNDDIKTVMQKIQRWYNIDVQYRGDLPTIQFNGTSSRNSNISQVLKKLEYFQTVHFKVEGRRVTVMK